MREDIDFSQVFRPSSAHSRAELVPAPLMRHARTTRESHSLLPWTGNRLPPAVFVLVLCVMSKQGAKMTATLRQLLWCCRCRKIRRALSWEVFFLNQSFLTMAWQIHSPNLGHNLIYRFKYFSRGLCHRRQSYLSASNACRTHWLMDREDGSRGVAIQPISVKINLGVFV